MSQPIDYMQYTVLYVDDEEQALKYFRKGFADEFQVLTAPNVNAANAILDAQAHRIAVVLSDQRMPGASGTALLARVRENWPQITRILVTAHAELESAIDAVNAGAVFKYMTKPVEWDDLRNKLRQGIDHHVAAVAAKAAPQPDAHAVRRQIVADRVRSLSHMASGINHHVRNSITALSCFLEEANPAEAAAPGAVPNPYLRNLWQAATEERDQLISRIDQIHRWLTPGDQKVVGDVPVQTLLASAVEGLAPGRVTLNVAAADQAATFSLATAPAVRALATLIKFVCDRTPAAGTTVTQLPVTQTAGQAFVPIRIAGAGPAWSDETVNALFTPFDVPEADPSELGLAMTAAFSFVYECGGDIRVHPAPPDGPGFEVLFPLNRAAAAA